MHSHEVLKSLHFNTFMQLSLIYMDFESINFLIIIFLTRFAIVVLYSLIVFFKSSRFNTIIFIEFTIFAIFFSLSQASSIFRKGVGSSKINLYRPLKKQVRSISPFTSFYYMYMLPSKSGGIFNFLYVNFKKKSLLLEELGGGSPPSTSST